MATTLAHALRWMLILAAVGAAGHSLWGWLGPTPPAVAARVWICPMHPQIRQDRPGTCPICQMDLVAAREVAAGSAAADRRGHGRPAAASPPAGSGQASARLPPPAAAEITHPGPAQLALLGARTLTVQTTVRTPTLLAFAATRLDPARVVRVQARTSGWIEDLAPLLPGDRVRRGAALATLYAREVEDAEIEWQAARHDAVESLGQEASAGLRAAAADRLRRLGVAPPGRARRATRGQVVVRAPIDGVILERGGAVGGYVGVGTSIFVVAELSELLLALELPAAEAAQLTPGMALQWQAPGGPVRTATLEAIEPTTDPAADTRRGRARLANVDGTVAVGRVGSATIALAPIAGLWLPADAVIDTGSERYVLRLEGDSLVPTAVEIGARVAEEVHVRAGLQAGDVVVRQGVFLLDADARLAAAAARSAAARDPAAVPPPLMAVTATAIDPGPAGQGGDPAAALAATLAVQAALVAEDAAAATAAAARVAAAAPHGGGLQARARAFPPGLEAQRRALGPLAEAAIALAAAHPAAAGELRVQYCSMAPGRWLAGAGPRENPYFGASMLRCGEDLGPAAGGAR